MYLSYDHCTLPVLEEINQEHLVMFTSGLDSLYVLFKIISRKEAAKLVYVESHQGVLKIERELNTIHFLLECLRIIHANDMGRISFEVNERIFTTGGVAYGNGHEKIFINYVQSSNWIRAMLDEWSIDTASGIIGYHLEDGRSTQIDKAIEVWDAEISAYTNDPLPTKKQRLYFPLGKKEKYENIKDMIDQGGWFWKALMAMTWTCEIVGYDKQSCGRCRPCRDRANYNSLLGEPRGDLVNFNGFKNKVWCYLKENRDQKTFRKFYNRVMGAKAMTLSTLISNFPNISLESSYYSSETYLYYNKPDDEELFKRDMKIMNRYGLTYESMNEPLILSETSIKKVLMDIMFDEHKKTQGKPLTLSKKKNDSFTDRIEYIVF